MFCAVLLFALGASAQGNILSESVTGVSSRPKGKQVKVAPSYAWSISEPLGLHYESTIDTLMLNYHKASIPSHQSLAWATTGNFGASGQNQIFFERKPTSDSSLPKLLRAGCQVLRHSVTITLAFR